MRILQVHNYYQHAGGEDAVVAAERELLQSRGHEVALCATDNDHVRGVVNTMVTGVRAIWSHAGVERVFASVTSFRPDIVHVHNFFPQFSPAIYEACTSHGAAVVQTLHNFRTVCAGGLLMRNGVPCESCVGRTPIRAVVHGCYRASRLASVAPATMIALHGALDSWRHVDAFIALTDFARTKFIAGGFPERRVLVKPNFVGEPWSKPVESHVRQGALYVGRLSPEKGIDTLIEVLSQNDSGRVTVLGGGPLLQQCKAAGLDVRGPSQSDVVVDAMRHAQFLLMPSVCYEGFPRTLVEAFASSLPVIASRIGSIAELVRDGITGLLVPPGDAVALAGAMRWAFANPEAMRSMGLEARREFEARYTAEANYAALSAVYTKAMATRAVRGGAQATRSREQSVENVA